MSLDMKQKVSVSMNKNCSDCKGSGIVNGWVSPDGDYDFEWCDCNPNHETPEM